MSRTRTHLAALLVAALTLGLAAVVGSSPARAFKPYTHTGTGDTAMADAIDDGRVTIGDLSYAVRPQVVDALRKWPTYYRAGTIGPDGFPDLTFGQSVIHPDRTGAWLRYVLRSAWAAQSDSSYTAAEKGQILAFAYGFLTHAAGDVWAHTLINDFSQGVFPEAKEILTSVPKAAIALRHIIVEGYVGDATAGFDGNPARTTLPDGDISDDSTPAVRMDAPVKWLYRTLVDPRASLPTGGCGNGRDDDHDGVADDGCFGNGPYTRGKPEQQRGPLIDHFLDLQSDLQLREQLLQADRKHRDCWIKDPDCYKRSRDVWVDTVRGRRHGQITVQMCIGARFGCVASGTDLAEDKVTTALSETYLEHWIDDIERGLRDWGHLGLATTRGLFDPQARRNLQNVECSEYPDSSAARESCEKQIGVTAVVMDQARWFINHRLLSMLGAPDATGAVLDAIRTLSKFLDSVVGAAFNPLRIPLAELEKRAKALILKELRKVVGIDIATLDHMLKNPSAWMETEQIQLDLGQLGVQKVNLFPPGTRARLDRILGLTEADRRTTTVPMPDGSTKTVGVLSDSAVMRNAAPFDNAVTLSKLLLLDASGLNKVITDNLVGLGVMKGGAHARVYRESGVVPANVMVDGLSGGEPWLQMIDGDHAWRKDGAPRFGSGAGHGGNGNFPLWESCLVRPAFAGALFNDWENGTAGFPDLGDDTSGDWADTSGPTSTFTVDAPSFLRKGGMKMKDAQRFLGAGKIVLRATDTIFSDTAVKQRMLLKRPEGFTQRFFGGYGEVLLTDTDGADDGYRYVSQRVGDPCNPMVQRKAITFTLDTRDPVVTVTSPAHGTIVDSASKIPIAWTAHDPGGRELASGVDEDATEAYVDQRSVSNGGTLSTFNLYPGGHSLEVMVFDNVKNSSGGFTVFEVQATSDSLVLNVGQGGRAFLDDAVEQQLEEFLVAAADHHAAGDHAAEGDRLTQARQLLVDERGTGIRPGYADYMIALIEDLLSRHMGPTL